MNEEFSKLLLQKIDQRICQKKCIRANTSFQHEVWHILKKMDPAIISPWIEVYDAYEKHWESVVGYNENKKQNYMTIIFESSVQIIIILFFHIYLSQDLDTNLNPSILFFVFIRNGLIDRFVEEYHMFTRNFFDPVRKLPTHEIKKVKYYINLFKHFAIWIIFFIFFNEGVELQSSINFIKLTSILATILCIFNVLRQFHLI